MRKNRRDSIRKERIIMVTSSALVLAALTMTGLYMRGQEAKQQDDGYTLDFSALENSQNNRRQGDNSEQAKNTTAGKSFQTDIENDLDYMPLDEELSAQAGSHLVEIPGLTDGIQNNAPDAQDAGDGEDVKNKQAENSGDENQDGEKKEENQQAAVTLHYNEDQGLTRPVSGEVLLPYSMDGSIYFATLDQYKYNPATVFSAEEGTDVLACAEAKVTKVYEDAELGHAVTLDLGDGYVVTYGQLTDIQVTKDSYVKAGEKLGTVAAPSRYYCLDGSNLYFRMEKDGAPLNAENLF
ncbi:MAG: M23 family metallopeptidase [Acetatifactor sp.]|nr:M23 family metallopeptidase [Acetatifactor sp.]